MSELVKDQHYVPQAYLKHFSNIDAKIFTIDYKLIKENKKAKVKVSKPKSTAMVGYVEHLYTLNDKSKFSFDRNRPITLNPMYLEKDIFKKYEGIIYQLINKIIIYNILSGKESLQFAQIIIDLKLRNLYIRDALKPDLPKLIKSTNDEVGKAYIKKYGANFTTKKELKAFKRNLNFITASLKNEKGLDRRLHNEALVNRDFTGNQIRNFEAEMLLTYEWIILRTNNNIKFITSDNPGYTYDLETDTIQNSKLKSKFVLFFPLNPNNTLMITDQKIDKAFICSKITKFISIQHAKASTVEQLNYFAAEKAYRFLIADSQDSLKRFEV